MNQQADLSNNNDDFIDAEKPDNKTEMGETEPPETETDETGEADNDEGEVVISIGDDSPPSDEETEVASAPLWVKSLRKAHREAMRENRNLKQQLNGLQNPTKKPVELGKKPQLQDYDYDEDQYTEALTTWFERKREVEAEAAAEKQREQDAQKTWQATLDNYDSAKKKLRVPDFEEAEATLTDTLSATQQGIIIHATENPAALIYALGKNDNKLKELATIKDPVKFAVAIGKIEKDIRVTKRNAPPPPERRVTGTAPNSGAVDSHLERLRAEAERTGDYTKVTAYRRQRKAK